MNSVEINKDRLEQSISTLAQFTDPDKPFTRRAFTPIYHQARLWLKQQFESLGLAVHLDESANMIARLESKHKKTIAIGSHIDTVPNGGRFDGILGVLVGLEIINVIKENNLNLKHNIEVIDFLSEEVSDFGLSCIGSRGMTRKFTLEMFDYKNPQELKLADAMNLAGADILMINNKPARTDLCAFIECHIEQGRILESEHLDVGVVDSVVGLSKLQLVFDGTSNHAGTTPMDLRSDAMLVAATFIVEMTKKAKAYQQNSKKYLVATAGQISISPNASNVIAGKAIINLDIRSSCGVTKDSFINELIDLGHKIANEHQAKLSHHQLLSHTQPLTFDNDIVQLFKKSCEARTFKHKVMPSGAGHDCAFLSQIAPAAMIFVPSQNGISHSPEEYTSTDQLAKGCEVMLDTLLKIDSAFI